MASSKKGSAGRSKPSSRSASSKTGSKPSGPKQLHKSAQKQTTAVARGGAGQKKSAKASAAKPTPVRAAKSSGSKSGKLKAVGNAVRTAAKKITSVLKRSDGKSSAGPSKSASTRGAQSEKTAARKPRRTSDLDVNRLDEMATGQVSSKGPFDAKRSDALRQQDIDTAYVNRNAEWADEDHFTNKSGDKRIGTKNRTYE